MTLVETTSFPSLIALGNALLLPHMSLPASNDTEQTLPVTRPARHFSAARIRFSAAASCVPSKFRQDSPGTGPIRLRKTRCDDPARSLT